MMKIIADLHFHSKYSRAVSDQMVLPQIAQWAKIKGINLLGTADFTHPLWFRELKAGLAEAGEGIYRVKGTKETEGPLFLFSTEISCIYTQGGKVRRIHNLIFAPSLEEAEKIGVALAHRGNVMSDGRPIFGLSAKDIADLVFNVSPRALIIPAHAWTPWFSLYGSQSGFDSLEECFGNLSKNIFAIETGLSSDPAMNWRIGELDNRSILSFSDAHSGAKLGREATVFEVDDITRLGYEDIRKAIALEHSENSESQKVGKSENQKVRISHTIEFHPEEGKYHFTGHRNCSVVQSPEDTNRLGSICPVCGKRLTVGVMHRVEQLAQQTQNSKPKTQNDECGVRWLRHLEEKRPPYVMLVPLVEILAESLQSTTASQKTLNEYKNLTEELGGEFNVLLKAGMAEITKIAGERVAEGIKKVRSGNIVVEPGYDGVFGTVKIWSFAGVQDKSPGASDEIPEEAREQMSLF